MRNRKFLLQVLAASLALFVLGHAVPFNVPGEPVALLQEIASVLLIGSVLCWVAARSPAGGAVLIGTLAGFHFILSSAMNIPEGVLFDVVTVQQAPLMMVHQLGLCFLMAVVVTGLFGRWKPQAAVECAPATEMSAIGLTWRLAASVVVFAVCYCAAGAAIFPLVKSYYAGRAMPGPEALFAMIALRAVLLVFAAILVLRIIPGRKDGQWILATAFPVLGIVSLMVLPNDIMPPFVRLVHAVETVPYYALCGFLFALWFGRPKPAAIA